MYSTTQLVFHNFSSMSSEVPEWLLNLSR
jgi:hypothetical protein